MNQNRTDHLANVLNSHQDALLDAWMREQLAPGVRRADLISDAELREQSAEFLRLLRDAAAADRAGNADAPAWDRVREFLTSLSRTRGVQGFSPAQTANFVFSLKQALFDELRRNVPDPAALLDDIWTTTALLDKFGLYTTEVHQRSREEVILRQQQDMLELSTPVVKLWDGILALPMIGTLDSARTQIVMETLLQKIVETGSEIAIIDITGVPTVDTLVAQHLIKTVTAARLMGADCIISGIRPQIAQTIVHLGVDLAGITTKATLADAFTTALKRRGRVVENSAIASGR